MIRLFKRNKNNENQAADRQRIAFNHLAEEFESRIVGDLVKEDGIVDSEKLQKLRNKKYEIGRKIDEYVNEMMSFSIKYAIKMYNDGKLDWDGIPKRESYAALNEPGGEFHKVIMLFALKKAAEKGYESVEKSRNAGDAALLEYYFVRLGALLKDENTIKYDRFMYCYMIFTSHLSPIFAEFGRLGINAKNLSEIGSWFMLNFNEDYVDPFNKLINEYCGLDIPSDLLELLNKTLNLGATRGKPQ